jgi:hypothetical protein
MELEQVAAARMHASLSSTQSKPRGFEEKLAKKVQQQAMELTSMQLDLEAKMGYIDLCEARLSELGQTLPLTQDCLGTDLPNTTTKVRTHTSNRKTLANAYGIPILSPSHCTGNCRVADQRNAIIHLVKAGDSP